MRKRIFPIVVCLAAVALTSCRAKPMTLDEYRRCREAIYCYYNNQMDFQELQLEIFVGKKPFRAMKGEISPTFCYCGIGWDRMLWEGILGKPVKVRVLESIVKGDERCTFVVHIPRDEAPYQS